MGRWATLVLLGALVGCGPHEQLYTITIDGEAGTRFRGTCLAQHSKGEASQSIGGLVPQSLELAGSYVSCTVINSGNRGTVSLTIRGWDGSLAAQGSSDSPYGLITVRTK